MKNCDTPAVAGSTRQFNFFFGQLKIELSSFSSASLRQHSRGERDVKNEEKS